MYEDIYNYQNEICSPDVNKATVMWYEFNVSL
jgi:hypothetical protein